VSYIAKAKKIKLFIGAVFAVLAVLLLVAYFLVPQGEAELDFNVGNIFIINIGGMEIWITETIVNTWYIMAFLIGIAVIIRIKLRKPKDVPKGLQNVVESLIELFEGMLKGAAGEKLMFLGGWFFTVFTFILISNFSGMVGLRPPTADWATTFSMALVTFVLIQVMGIKFRKGKYLKSLVEPHPAFLPLNLVGELARPVSLSFRLYGNVLAGMILVTMLYSLTPIFVQLFIPMAIHAYFDLVSGALQTYVFCILSMTFIGVATQDD
jgi:F-type H+-transporting ATPase subunit a